jgi:hypothetical protein
LSESQQQIKGTTQTPTSFPRLRLVVALNPATDEWHRGRCSTRLMSVGANSGPYARTSLPLTWCQRPMVGAAQTDIRHLVALHLASSTVLFTAMFDVQSGTCSVNLACTSCSRGHRSCMSTPDAQTPQRMQESARCEISTLEARAVPSITQWIGGEYLRSYDKEGIVPRTRLNHDLLTSLAQVVPDSRYHFLPRYHSSCTRQMCCVTTMRSLDPDPGITL